MKNDPANSTYHKTKRIDSLNEVEFNALPFGAIKLDHDGTILKYNLYESKMAERDVNEVIGKNFFTEVAPCTNVQAFAGAYYAGMAEGELNTTFPYRFLFPNRVIDVEITLLSSANGKTAWVFVKQGGRL